MAKGIWSLFRWLRDVITFPGDIATVVKILLPSGGVAAVTAWAAKISHEQLHWIIVATVLALAGTAHALNQIVRYYRQNTIFEKIRFSQVQTSQVLVNDNEKYTLGMEIKFFNHSERPIYFSLEKAHASLDGRTNEKAKIRQTVSVINGKSDQTISVAGIPSLDWKELIKGKIDFVLHYGPSRDRLKYALDQTSEIIISLHKEEDGKTIGTASRANHLRIEHSRI